MKDESMEKAMREFGRLIGKRYGSIGGKKAALVMTPEQKRARALKANLASQESKRLKRLAREEAE